MKIILIPLPKRVLMPFGLTAAASATGAGSQKKTFWSGTTLVRSNEEIKGIIKIVTLLQIIDTRCY